MSQMRTIGLAKFACPEPGCEFKGGSKQSLQVHKARKHSGKNWSTVKGAKLKKKEEAPASAANGVAPTETAQPFACEKCEFVGRSAMSLKMHVRRMHTARAKPWRSPGTVNFKGRQGIQEQRSQEAQHGVNFCPGCGWDLRALHLVVRFKKGEA
jgi:predicted RNA-binding Zn-ribbon protein involved in translation (DUF1610 family)